MANKLASVQDISDKTFDYIVVGKLPFHDTRTHYFLLKIT